MPEQYNISISMLKKPMQIKLSPLDRQPSNLTPIDSQLITEELPHLVRTPRCVTFKKEQLLPPTQNLEAAWLSKSLKERLPAIQKMRTDLKENLLDLDLCFNMEPSDLCQNHLTLDRHSFAIRKLRTQSISSKGKKTATGSSQSSLDEVKMDCVDTNATDRVDKKKDFSRGRSQSKQIKTCRIVNSKKLPFELHPHKLRKQKSTLEDKLKDISAIEQKDNPEPFISEESYQNLCKYF